ncbi:MAG: thiamine-phosphate kinase [Hyphomicrobiales bacterium]
MQDKPSEFELIERYLRPLTTDPSAFSLKDDAAILHVPDGKQLVVSKDLLIAGSHFFPDDAPKLIAQKAVRSNVSDLIAKGAKPYRYSLGLAFSKPPSHCFMEAFAEGLREDQAHYGWSLIGGDTTKSPSDFMISITAYGLCDEGRMVPRSGAKVGDQLYVSGTLGDSALGLCQRQKPEFFAQLNADDQTYLDDAYLLPQPPIGLEEAIADCASASMDISDGLFSDLAHMCRASGVSAEIDQQAIPLSLATQNAIGHEPNLTKTVLKGGDDYQCLMAVSIEQEKAFNNLCSVKGLKVRKIGVFASATEPLFRITNGSDHLDSELDGFTHF